VFWGRREIDRELGRTWPMAEGTKGSAVFSECGNYRYYLSRKWGEGAMVMWLCMNPSSATDIVDDDTSKKLTRHSRQFGYGGLFLLNVMDYRATKPADLPPGIERSGRNLHYIKRCANLSAQLIVAYGGLQHKAAWLEYANQALRECPDIEKRCVRHNKDGSPRHPRGFAAALERQPFGQG
jgi:hypothetical protein